MTKIIFVRHAEKEKNIEVADRERPLTAAGILASEALVQQLEAYCFDRIFSSPFKRAMDTVEPLAKANKLNVEEVIALQERLVKRTGIEKPDDYVARQWEDFNYKLAGGESLNEVQKRLIDTIEQLVIAFPTETVLIGTHGTALATILNYYDETFGIEQYKKLKPKMPYAVEMIFQGKKLITTNVLKLS